MTRINLVKYGFIRFPEEDFSDDGNRFTCYRFSDTDSHISKLVADGQAYLSCHIVGQLPYDTYSKLPNYQAAEAAIVYPTETELQHKCLRIQTKLTQEMNELETLIGKHAVEAAVKFSKWEWEQLRKYLTYMLQELSKYKPDAFIPDALGTARSITFLQGKEDTEPTYWYKSIKEMFQKYSIV